MNNIHKHKRLESNILHLSSWVQELGNYKKGEGARKLGVSCKLNEKASQIALLPYSKFNSPSQFGHNNNKLFFHGTLKASAPLASFNNKTNLNIIRKIITTKNLSPFVNLPFGDEKNQNEIYFLKEKQMSKKKINLVNKPYYQSAEIQKDTIKNIPPMPGGDRTNAKLFRLKNQSQTSKTQNLDSKRFTEPIRNLVNLLGPFDTNKQIKNNNNIKTKIYNNKIYKKIPIVYKNLFTIFPLFLNSRVSLQAILAGKTKTLNNSRKKFKFSTLLFSTELYSQQNDNQQYNLQQTTKGFQSSYSKMMEINLITISLASANRIRQWAEKTLPNGKVVGEIINPETVHYKTLKPIKGGLFCERIFGPLKDHECACGKKFNIKNYLAKVTPNVTLLPRGDENNLVHKLQKRYFCRVCDVEYTYSIIRRTQLGFIQLASPTTHVWFVKGIPSYISILLDMKKKHLQNVTYNAETLTLEHAFRGRQYLPSSPSSIFESWQKIMKMQYPEKYGNKLDSTSTGSKKRKPLGNKQSTQKTELELKNQFNYNKKRISSSTLKSDTFSSKVLPLFLPSEEKKTKEENDPTPEIKDKRVPLTLFPQRENKKEGECISNHLLRLPLFRLPLFLPSEEKKSSFCSPFGGKEGERKESEALLTHSYLDASATKVYGSLKTWRKDQKLLYKQNKKKYYSQTKPSLLTELINNSSFTNINNNTLLSFKELKNQQAPLRLQLLIDTEQTNIPLEHNSLGKINNLTETEYKTLVTQKGIPLFLKSSQQSSLDDCKYSPEVRKKVLSGTVPPSVFFPLWGTKAFIFLPKEENEENEEKKRKNTVRKTALEKTEQSSYQYLNSSLRELNDCSNNSYHYIDTIKICSSIYSKNYSKKGRFPARKKPPQRGSWFILASNFSTKKTQNQKVTNNYCSSEARLNLTNIYISMQNDLQLLITLLVKEMDCTINKKAFTNNVSLTQIFSYINALVHFSFNNSFLSSNNSAFFYKQELLNMLKLKTKKQPIPLYLLFVSKDQLFLNILRTKLFHGTYKTFLPAVPSNAVYKYEATTKLKHGSQAGLSDTLGKVVEVRSKKNCSLFFNIPLVFSQQLLSYSVLKVWKIFIKINQKTICFLTTNNEKVKPDKLSKHKFSASEQSVFTSELVSFNETIKKMPYSPGSLEILNDFACNIQLDKYKYCSLTKAKKLNTGQVVVNSASKLNVFTKHFINSLVNFTHKTLSSKKPCFLTASLDLFSLQSLAQNTKKQHASYKDLQSLFILTKSLKSYNLKSFPFGDEKYTTKLAVMLLLNLTNHITARSLNDKKKKITTKIKIFNSFKNQLKIKLVKRLQAFYLFNQGLHHLELVKNLSKKNRSLINAYNSKYIPFGFVCLWQKEGERKAEDILSPNGYLQSHQIEKRQQVLRQILVKANNHSPLANFFITLSPVGGQHSAKQINKSLKYLGSLKTSKILTLYFFFLKQNKKKLAYKLYNSLMADFETTENKYLKYLFVLKTFFSYKFKSGGNIQENSKYSLLNKPNTYFKKIKNANPYGKHYYVMHNLSNRSPKSNASQCVESNVKNLLVNNIYSLSHRELWEQEKDWQDFAYYYYSPTNITDIPIPLYKHRNYDLLFSIDNTLTYTASDHFPVQTQYYSLGMNINTAFSGAGLIQKLLNEFNYSELKKMDKQNRILLFEYNKHIKKLKKIMHSRLIKSRLEYYKACHIRDVLIRRTKLTRKIFNKVLPYDFIGNTPVTSANKSQNSLKDQPSMVMSATSGKQTSHTIETNGLNMILTLLPVLPPVLRPVLKMSGQFTISDLNRLYQRIIYRNERLKKFLKDPALSSSFEMKYAQRLLQEAVDNLIQNGKSGVVPEKDARGRLLKSLSDILKGKQGRFRQYLLGKRVDYSGRSVIVVGPRLKLHECGIPKEMALVLYSPFLIKRILNEKLADTYLSAKKLIQTNPLLVSQLLREIMKSCPVLLNRAPTLHRLGFQAFQPKLVDGKAILLHPLVCPAFNADFDGDQMAVHVPITFEARAEAWKLMLARNNLLSPATGEPIILPSQDMVLGCYYLTTNCAEKWSKYKKGSGMYFHNINDVLKAYNQQLIHVHAIIWVNITGHVENANTLEQPLELRISLPGFKLNKRKQVKKILVNNNKHIKELLPLSGEEKQNKVKDQLNYIEIYSKSHNILTFNSTLTNQIIRTTPGKILFNMIIKNAIEKRPALLSKYTYEAGLIKNKLINTFDLETTNFFTFTKGT